MAFQVVDDLLDVSAEEQVVGKPVGNDLRSGVLTLPVLHLIRRQGFQGEAASLVGKGAKMTAADIDRVLQLVRENGAVEYAFDVAQEFVAQAKDALVELPANETRELLIQIAESTLSRSFEPNPPSGGFSSRTFGSSPIPRVRV